MYRETAIGACVYFAYLGLSLAESSVLLSGLVRGWGSSLLAVAKTTHLKLRKAIISTCLDMNRLGINQGVAGNVSARIPDGYLITPSGVAYESMKPDQVVAMDLDGDYLGGYLPSSEWRMHLDLYRSRPEAGAVVHTHATFCTSLACLREGIPAFHYMVAVAGGNDIRCARYATFGTQALSDHMLEALRDRRACLLANHGMICFGDDLDKALRLAVEVETLASQYWHARQTGNPVILSDEEMRVVLERFESYGRQSHELEVEFEPAAIAGVQTNREVR